METFSALLVLCAGNSPVNPPHKGQWRGALMFCLICAWKKNGWVKNRDAGELRRHHAHYDVAVMNASVLLAFPKLRPNVIQWHWNGCMILPATWLWLHDIDGVPYHTTNRSTVCSINQSCALLHSLMVLSHTPLCISMISGVCVQGMWNAQVKGQVTETHRLKVNSHCDTALFISMYDITMVQP